jgi:ABC-type polar amino acid transport system ATPase subunit
MAIVEARDVHKHFSQLHVLKGISFEVDVGETVVFAGPSGSGKSTLLRCLNGLEKIQHGSIMVDGLPVHDHKVDLLDVRRRIGIVFQQFNLFPHLTVLKNITLPLIKAKGMEAEKAKTMAMDLLEKVDIAEKANVYPGNLSGGQQQRAAIARALAMEPKVVMFDEPTSALDPELTGGILEVMAGLAKEGMTMLVVTHEMGFARRAAKRMIFMDDGVIVESGKPEELIENPRQERTKRFMQEIGDN